MGVQHVVSMNYRGFVRCVHGEIVFYYILLKIAADEAEDISLTGCVF